MAKALEPEYLARSRTFESLRAGYQMLWADCRIAGPSSKAAAERQARAIISAKARYREAESATRVPWFVIATLHVREAGLRAGKPDFRAVLHNGERIVGTGRRTTLVPRGRGPFTTWLAAARDAASIEGLGKIDWYGGSGPARVAYACEKFNGFGYRQHGINSPYLWGGTNHQQRGKFVSDGVFDPGAWDSQIGAMALLKELMVLDKDVTFDRKPSPAPPLDKTRAGIWVALAAAAGAAAHWFDAHPLISVAVFVAILLLGLLHSRK
jgi:lysozyme family protein